MSSNEPGTSADATSTTDTQDSNTRVDPATTTTNAEQFKVDFRVYRPPQSTTGTPGKLFWVFSSAKVLRRTHHKSVDLPDSYFQPSAADLKAAQASLSARTQALVNAPLRTQAMREADDKVKKAKWPTVISFYLETAKIAQTIRSTV